MFDDFLMEAFLKEREAFLKERFKDNKEAFLKAKMNLEGCTLKLQAVKSEGLVISIVPVFYCFFGKDITKEDQAKETEQVVIDWFTQYIQTEELPFRYDRRNEPSYEFDHTEKVVFFSMAYEPIKYESSQVKDKRFFFAQNLIHRIRSDEAEAKKMSTPSTKSNPGKVAKSVSRSCWFWPSVTGDNSTPLYIGTKYQHL